MINYIFLVNGEPLLIFKQDRSDITPLLQKIAIRYSRYKDCKEIACLENAARIVFPDRTIIYSVGKEMIFDSCPTEEELDLLRGLLNKTLYPQYRKTNLLETIAKCFSYELYDELRLRLEDAQPDYNEIPNPSQADINKKIKELVWRPLT